MVINMQTIIFGLMIPVIPLLLWKSYNRGKELKALDAVLRYMAYTLLITLAVTVVMAVVWEEGASFQARADISPVFVVKFVVLEITAALLVAAAEWMYLTKRLAFWVDWEGYKKAGLFRFLRKYICPYGLYILAAVVVALNTSLMFDNVLWGDECFSANTAQKSAEGILQVMYYWDSHPPLYYYWLKLFGDILGHTGPVYHFASLVPFYLGILLAVTLVRKRLGKIPAAFFVILSGLAATSLEYNLEIRMYSLAFFCIAACYYCAYRIFCGGRAAWFAIVFWALAAAYSHYYGLVTAGILLFITYAAASIKYRGKTWIKGLVSLILFLAGYAPWMGTLFVQAKNVTNSWWVTETMGLRDCLKVVMGGAGMARIVFPLVLLLILVLFLSESSFFKVKTKGKQAVIQVYAPSLKGWSDHTYAAAVGVLTIVGTILAGYLFCVTIEQILVERYLYPLSAVTMLLLAVCSAQALALLGKLGERIQKKWPVIACKCVFLLLMAVMLGIGVGNFKAYSAKVKQEKELTEATLALMGEVPEDVKLVTNGVKHLGWTVLYYYFPDREVIQGDFRHEEIGGSNFWYFCNDFLSDGEVAEIQEKGYTVAGWGECQISQYPFVLYYFEK